jgi:hypothetical protein
MRSLRIFILSVIAVFMASCFVTSLHPLYTEEDLTFVPELLGTWENDEVWIFEKSGENVYELTIKEQESKKTGVYETHLVKLGKYLFLDMYPEESELEESFYDIHLVPTHSFWKVEIEKDVLRLAFMDIEWLEEMIDANKVNIAHVCLEERIVLTALTEELQKFVLKYAEDTDAFPELDEMHRKTQD